jgi:hypothetical protein
MSEQFVQRTNFGVCLLLRTPVDHAGQFDEAGVGVRCRERPLGQRELDPEAVCARSVLVGRVEQRVADHIVQFVQHLFLISSRRGRIGRSLNGLRTMVCLATRTKKPETKNTPSSMLMTDAFWKTSVFAPAAKVAVIVASSPPARRCRAANGVEVCYLKTR